MPDVVLRGSLRERPQERRRQRTHCKWARLEARERAVVMERFEMSQSTGDSRALDDGAKFGHASGAECRETLDLCTAVQRVRHARELVKALDTLGVPQPEQIKLRLKVRQRRSSYQGVPICPKKQFPNMVALWVIEVGWNFEELYSPVLGLTPAATVSSHFPNRCMPAAVGSGSWPACSSRYGRA